MIVDTSALIAILYREVGYEQLRDAIMIEGGHVPAPVLVEFARVATGRGKHVHPASDTMLQNLIPSSLDVEAFTAEDVALANSASHAHGLGNGRGGTLNLLGLMVYAVAKRLGLPVLCTGGDFAATDIDIHPASRTI